MMSPKERAVYTILGVGGLLFLCFLGGRQLKQSPSIVIEQPTSPISQFVPDVAGSQPQITSRSTVIVHVLGEVNHPGILELSNESRVNDAISLAGGAKPNADLDQLNLAAKLIDGSQLHVPPKGVTIEPTAATESAYSTNAQASNSYTKKANSRSASKLPSPGSISLNTATKSEFDKLPGVGPSTAQKILDYRQQTGGFSSINELLQVKGIGPKKLAAMRKYLRL